MLILALLICRVDSDKSISIQKKSRGSKQYEFDIWHCRTAISFRYIPLWLSCFGI